MSRYRPEDSISAVLLQDMLFFCSNFSNFVFIFEEKVKDSLASQFKLGRN